MLCCVVQEDAIVVNEASVQRGLFCSTTFSTHTFEEVSSRLDSLSGEPCAADGWALVSVSPLMRHGMSWREDDSHNMNVLLLI